jgi:hypothetical protein
LIDDSVKKEEGRNPYGVLETHCVWIEGVCVAVLNACVEKVIRSCEIATHKFRKKVIVLSETSAQVQKVTYE